MKYFVRLLRLCRTLLAVGVVIALCLYGGARLLSPLVPLYSAQIQAWISTALQRPVNIGVIAVEWSEGWPRLSLQQVSLLANNGIDPILNFSKISATLTVKVSLHSWHPLLKQLQLEGVRFKIRRQMDGTLHIDGFDGVHPEYREQFEKWALTQEHWSIKQGHIQWQDDQQALPTLDLTKVNLTVNNRGLRHQLEGSVQLPQSWGQRLAIQAHWLGNPLVGEGQGAIALQGWRLGAEPATESLPRSLSWGEAPSTIQLAYFAKGVAGQPEWRIQSKALDIADWSSILLAFPGLPLSFKTTLTRLNPHGWVRDLQVSYQADQPVANRWSGQLALVALTTQSWLTVPALGPLTAQVAFAEQKMTLRTTHDTPLQLPGFSEPLTLPAFGTQFSWQRHPDHWQFGAAMQSHATDDWAALAMQAGLTWPLAGIPALTLKVSVQDFNLTALSRYLPDKALTPTLRQWLNTAFVSGKVAQGSLDMAGLLPHFPFVEPDTGVLQAQLTLADTVFRFHPLYPPITQTQAQLQFQGRHLTAQLQHGQIQGYAIQQAVITLADWRKPVVLVQGQLQGDLTHGHEFLHHGPLKQQTAHYADYVQGEGLHTLRLDLAIPLGKSDVAKTPTIRLEVQLVDNTLVIADQFKLAAVTGNIHFDGHGLRAKQLTATHWGHPLRVDIIPKTADRGAVSQIFRLTGESNIQQWLRAYQQTAWIPYLTGISPWQAEVVLLAQQVGINLTTQLTGITSTLPAPLAKSTTAALPLTVDLQLTPSTRKLRFNLDSRLKGDALWLTVPHAPSVLHCGQLHLGSSPLQPCTAASGLQLTGALPQLTLAEWWPLLAAAQSVPMAATMTKQADVSIESLDVMGYRLQDVSIQASQLDWAWLLHILSPQLQGTLSIPFDLADAPIKADLDYLNWVTLPDAPQNTKNTHYNPAQLPAFQVQARQLSMNQQEWGQLSLTATRHPSGLAIKTLVKAADFTFRAEGAWTQSASKASQSQFDIGLDAPSLRTLFQLLGKPQTIEEGKISLQGKLDWPGAPQDWAAAKTHGQLALTIGKGSLPTIEPGFARLLGLFEVGTLSRRLDLDFRDVLQQGLVFDSIQGDFVAANGRLTTDNLALSGPNVQVTIQGETDLTTRHNALEVIVIPNVTAGLPMVGALAAGPAGAATLLLLQKLLGPELNKISQVRYEAQGPWEQLQIKRVSVVEK